MSMNSPIQLLSFKSQRKIVVFLMIFMTLVSFQSYAQLAGYSFKKKITIDNTKVFGRADLTDFPVMISKTDVYLKSTCNLLCRQETGKPDLINRLY